MSAIWNTIFYKPLYNGLVFLFDLLPWFDVGVVLIIFTVIVKLILFPLSKKSLTAQAQMKKIEPELKSIKEKYKNDQQEVARQTMDLYRKNKINPFASILVIIIQIPIIFALYFVFLKAGLPDIKGELLYSFISIPTSVNIVFLGLIDLSTKSMVLAALAGVSTFFQIRYSLSGHKTKPKTDKPSFKDDLVRSMSIQMKYVFPIVVVFIAYSLSGAIALYWITSNVFTLGQELVIRRKLKGETSFQPVG